MQPENRRIKSIKNQSNIVWLTAFVLAVLVAATIAVVGTCLYNYAHRSDCEISLYQGQVDSSEKSEQQYASNQAPKAIIQSRAVQYTGTQAKQQSEQSAFSVRDAEQVWKTETAIELFKADYRNSDGAVTVKSEDGDSVAAPGTEGSYTFSLKNTGNAAADYKIWVEAKLSSNMTDVPIETRMSGYSGWLLGGKNQWEQASALNGVEAEETIGAGKTVEYTIYWQWPFERDDDAADTALGNAAVSQDMTYTVTIYTLTAAASGNGNQSDQTDQTGKPFWNAVKTGDDMNLTLWMAVLIVSAGVVVYLIILKKRKNDDKNAHKESKQ